MERFPGIGTLEPGTRVGGYTIGERLGAGASGAVYRAQDDGGFEVALKLLHSDLDIDPEARVQMAHEVEVLQRFRDPNVAAVLDAELDGSEAFVVTELIPGPTLAAEIVHGGPLDPVDLYELADQLGTALQKVHQAGVVHRDIKPSNIIVAERGPVLIDFGIASESDPPSAMGFPSVEEAASRRLETTGHSGYPSGENLWQNVEARGSRGSDPYDVQRPHARLVMGTPGYLAPELLNGAAPTPATDWWSWAATLAFAATGRPPFGSGARDDVLIRTKQGRADLVGIPPRTATALIKALSPNPATRATPTEVLQAIRKDRDDLHPVADPHGIDPSSCAEGGAAAPTVIYPSSCAEGGAAAPTVVAGSLKPIAEPTLIAPTQLFRVDPDATTTLAPQTQRFTGNLEDQPALNWDPTQKLGWAELPGSRGNGAVVSFAPTDGIYGTDGQAGFALSSRGFGSPSVVGSVEPSRAEERSSVSKPRLAPVAYNTDFQPAPPALPYPQAPTWYRRPVPPHRTGILFAAAALLVALASGWPVLTFAAYAILVIIARIIGTAWEDIVDRRELAGRRRTGDAAVTVLKSPLILLKAIFGALPQILVGLGVAVLLAAAGWWYIGRYDLPADITSEHSYLLAITLASMAGIITTWFATNSAKTRLGARLALTAFGSGKVMKYLALAALLIGATIILVTHFTTPTATINWFPLPEPPRL